MKVLNIISAVAGAIFRLVTAIAVVYLIYQGAGIALSPEQILEEMGITPKSKEQNRKSGKIALEKAEDIVYSCLGLQAKNPEEMSLETGLLPVEILRILTSLELKGYVKEIYKNNYIRVL